MSEQLLQFGGRLHPVVLHLPIGLLFGLVVFELIACVRRKPMDRGTRLLLAWLVALSGAAAAGSGFLLGREDTYAGDTLQLHKWLGIGTGSACVVVALLATFKARKTYGVVLALTAAALAPAGHLGASMTHGEDFLFEPFAPPPAPPAANATFYEARVAPILDNRCGQCHNSTKLEGGLNLVTREGILAGGDSGTALEPGDPDRSELLVRIRLDIGDDDHMPPKSKGQVTPGELETLTTWIAEGASFDAANTGPAKAADAVPFAALPERVNVPDQALESLREAQVHAEPIDPSSGLLWVTFAARPGAPDEEIAGLLRPLAHAVGDLSLARTSAGEKTLEVVGRMTRLTRLDLSGTPVQSAGLSALRSLKDLRELRLTRVTLDDGAAAELAGFPALTTLHVWNSGMSDGAIASLRTAKPGLSLELGDSTSAGPVEQEPEPKFSSEAPAPGAAPAPAASLEPINDVCPISGSPANPKFSVVHNGRVVALCCEKCAAKFLLEPEKYPVAARK